MEVRNEIVGKILLNLINSMPQRLQQLIDNNGGETKYYILLFFSLICFMLIV